MPFKLTRIPRTDDELYEFVRARYGLTIPRHVVCTDHVAPFTAFADAFFARNSISPEKGITSIALWKGSRGLSGKSMALSVLGDALAELLGASVNLLGGGLAQSMNIHEHIGRALDHENAPKFMVLDQTASKIKFSNMAEIRPLTASPRTVRGPHPPRLLLDEIDEMEQLILDAALGQPMTQKNYKGIWIKPYTVMCSTWQHPRGTFATMQQRAEEKDWPQYTWCYRESANPIDGWLTQEAIQEKKNSIPKAMWDTEYELNEPAIGTRAFDPDAVARTFSLPVVNHIEFKEAKDFEEYRFEKKVRGARYVAGADWGKKVDYTVIVVLRVDVRPYQLVYYMRVNRRPWPQMIGWFNKAVHYYSAAAIHDATGLGDVVEDLTDIRAEPFIMSGAERSDLFSEYIVDVEHGHYRLPQIKSLHLAHRFCEVDDLYMSGPKHHPPDEVVAMALANHAARELVPLVGPEAPPKSGEPTEMEMRNQEVDVVDEHTGVRRQGERAVRAREEDPNEFSLLV